MTDFVKLVDELEDAALDAGATWDRCTEDFQQKLEARVGAAKAALYAALSAQSTGSAGVAAEPVAWIWEERYDGNLWGANASPLKPARRTNIRNIRPLYEHPPVAAEPVVGNLRDALAPFAAAWQACQDLGEQCAGYVEDDDDAWVSGNRNGGAYPLFKFGDLRRAAEALAAAPTPPAGSGETEAKPYDPVRGRMAKGCCSAVSPCSHQQRDPTTLCEICQKAARLTDKILAAEPCFVDESEAAELAASERISAAQAAYDYAMADYDPTAPDHEVQAFDAMKEAIAVADARAPVALQKGPTEEEIARALCRHQIDLNLAMNPREEPWSAENRQRAEDYGWENFAKAASYVAALLTPADRGETQAVGDGPVFQGGHIRNAMEGFADGTEKHIGAEVTLLVLPGQEQNLPEPWRAAAREHMPPSPDQNRGEPDQGGAITEDRT